MNIRLTKTIVYFAATFIVLMMINTAYASVLQISGWNASIAEQNGTVGTTGVTITSTNLPWNGTFIDEYAGYASSNFGSLAQPAGTIGDFANQVLNNGDVFDITIALNGPLLNPTIYVTDFDTVGSWVEFPSGGTTFVASADGSFSADTMTANYGDFEGHPGAWGAVQYLGSYNAGDFFTLSFNFNVASSIGRENIGVGISAVDVGGNTPVPEPATMFLFGLGLLGLAGANRRKK